MFKVLLIDDTKSVHSFVKALLAKAKDISVESVFDGSQAIELLKNKTQFDLIFLDWEMPILNGPSTFAKIREMNLSIPTVMMTTKNSPEDIQKMLEMGVAEYLIKPFTVDILFEKIEFATGQVFKDAA